MSVAKKLDSIAESNWFKNSITGVILLAGVLVGLETYPKMMDRYGVVIHVLDSLIISIFVVEMVIRIGAYGRHPERFFCDAWNVFDFVIVAICLLPFHTEYVAVVRMVRVLRVLRLVTALPALQMLVGALLKSIPSIGYISVLLFLHFYIYACLATFLFSHNDPVHFGTLHESMLTLFQVVTLEGWNDIMYAQMYGTEFFPVQGIGMEAAISSPSPIAAPLFFVSFILFGTMIILNLFIGVIMNGMAEMQAEHSIRELEEKRSSANLTLADEVHLILNDIDTLKEQLSLIRKRMDEPNRL